MQKAYCLVFIRMLIYEEHSVVLEDGDFIAMMTDGVTETEPKTGFIDDEVIKNIMWK